MILMVVPILVLVYFKKWPVSYALIVTNFIVYFIKFVYLFLPDSYTIYGSVYLDLGFRARYLVTGEAPYTIFTSMFIHGDIMHILMNMVVLMFIGPPLEEKIGSRNFALTYIITGICGTIFSSIFALNYPILGSSPDTIGIGASGAIFGILGIFAALYPRDEIPMFLVFIYLQRVPVVLAAIVFMVAETAYVASGVQDGVGHLVHLGSLVSGLAIAPLLKRQMEKSESISKTIEEPDYSALDSLAVTDELKTILERIKKEDNKEIHSVWLNFFMDKAKCPKCNSKLSYTGKSIHCKCGFEVKSQPKA
ncbi:MAG: rhomboid family intramembrane serine protease [Thermoplasmata archaeon]